MPPPPFARRWQHKNDMSSFFLDTQSLEEGPKHPGSTAEPTPHRGFQRFQEMRRKRCGCRGRKFGRGRSRMAARVFFNRDMRRQCPIQACVSKFPRFRDAGKWGRRVLTNNIFGHGHGQAFLKLIGYPCYLSAWVSALVFKGDLFKFPSLSNGFVSSHSAHQSPSDSRAAFFPYNRKISLTVPSCSQQSFWAWLRSPLASGSTTTGTRLCDKLHDAFVNAKPLNLKLDHTPQPSPISQASQILELSLPFPAAPQVATSAFVSESETVCETSSYIDRCISPVPEIADYDRVSVTPEVPDLDSTAGSQAITAAVDFDVATEPIRILSNTQLTETVSEELIRALQQRVYKLQSAILDIKRITELGELPISLEDNGQTVRVHFPNSDPERVELLLKGQEIECGKVIEVETGCQELPSVSEKWDLDSSVPDLSHTISTVSESDFSSYTFA